MTVTELISQLLTRCNAEGLDPRATRVYCDGYEGGARDLPGVTAGYFERDQNPEGWYGDHEERDRDLTIPMTRTTEAPPHKWRHTEDSEADPEYLAEWEEVKARCDHGIYVSRSSHETP